MNKEAFKRICRIIYDNCVRNDIFPKEYVSFKDFVETVNIKVSSLYELAVELSGGYLVVKLQDIVGNSNFTNSNGFPTLALGRQGSKIIHQYLSKDTSIVGCYLMLSTLK